MFVSVLSISSLYNLYINSVAQISHNSWVSRPQVCYPELRRLVGTGLRPVWGQAVPRDTGRDTWHRALWHRDASQHKWQTPATASHWCLRNNELRPHIIPSPVHKVTLNFEKRFLSLKLRPALCAVVFNASAVIFFFVRRRKKLWINENFSLCCDLIEIFSCMYIN